MLVSEPPAARRKPKGIYRSTHIDVKIAGIDRLSNHAEPIKMALFFCNAFSLDLMFYHL
jgi:hypothetical protein